MKKTLRELIAAAMLLCILLTGCAAPSAARTQSTGTKDAPEISRGYDETEPADADDVPAYTEIEEEIAPCAVCNDTHVVTTTVACSACGGTGMTANTVACPACGGAGGWYNPNAYYDAIMGWMGQWQPCGGCGGAAFVTNMTACSACGGVGTVAATVPCPNCGE